MAILGRGGRGPSPFVAPSLAVLAAALSLNAGLTAARGDAPAQKPACQGDNGGLTLSPGFCATIFADNLGHVRHIVAAPDGMLYGNTWSGLSLSEIRSEYGDGEVLRELASAICGQRPERLSASAHLCSEIDACERHCNSAYTREVCGADVARQQHVHSAMEIVERLAGRECPWREVAV
jgi:hypothetical protein